MNINLTNNIQLNPTNRIYVHHFPETGDINKDRKLIHKHMKEFEVFKASIFSNKILKTIPIYIDVDGPLTPDFTITYKPTTDMKDLAFLNNNEEKLLINLNYSPKLIKLVEDCPNTYIISFHCHSQEMCIYQDS